MSMAVVWIVLYLLTIPAANWTISTYGAVPVGFGLYAPAGVYFAGLAFTFRDLVHERIGRWWTLAAIMVGGWLSLAVADVSLAAASASVFAISELVDFAIYVPLRRRGFLRAVAASNAVALVVDSALFLWLAFGSLEYLPGLIVAKLYVTLAAVGMLWTARRIGRMSFEAQMFSLSLVMQTAAVLATVLSVVAAFIASDPLAMALATASAIGCFMLSLASVSVVRATYGNITAASREYDEPC